MHTPFDALCMMCMRVANTLEDTSLLLPGNRPSLGQNILWNFFIK
jgi:hypothetical protein